MIETFLVISARDWPWKGWQEVRAHLICPCKGERETLGLRTLSLTLPLKTFAERNIQRWTVHWSLWLCSPVRETQEHERVRLGVEPGGPAGHPSSFTRPQTQCWMHFIIHLHFHQHGHRRTGQTTRLSPFYPHQQLNLRLPSFRLAFLALGTPSISGPQSRLPLQVSSRSC